MRVALVHDDLVQWGGAERVLLGLCEIYPDAPIFTSVCDFDNLMLKHNFVNKKIITSFLQKIPRWKGLYKTLLPFYPIAFEQFNFDDFDLVISHTTRFAKSIITKPQTKHICYCHTPPRFLWHFSGQPGYGVGEILMTKLRIYDQISAKRVDHFIAGSENAKRRIKKIYNEDAKVVYPFVDMDRFKNIEIFDGGYLVMMGRANKYKRLDLAIEACSKLGVPLKVIGRGDLGDKGNWGDRAEIEFLGELDEQMVVEVLAGCKSLIIPGEEDFGLVALEAQALGKPVIAFRAGGSLETVEDEKTGIFFDSQDVSALMGAINRLNRRKINPHDCESNANRFSKDNFTRNFKQTVASLVYT